MTKRLVFMAACAAALLTSGCASIIGGNHLMDKMLAEPEKNRLTVTPFDPQVGGPTVSVDLFDLYREHPGAMIGLNLLDVASGYAAYKIGENSGWWGSDGGGSSKSAKSEVMALPSQTGRDTIYVQGNHNTFDTSSKDDHSMVPAESVTP